MASVSDIAFRGEGVAKTRRSGSAEFRLHPIDVTLRLGEITALVGENGNGKTTLLNIIGQRLTLDDGRLAYPALEGDRADPYSIRGQIGYMPQELTPWHGPLADNLIFTAAIRGLTGERNVEEVEFLIYRLGLERYRSATWDQLSGGFKMRFQLARILLSGPRLLILDEPLANLDVSTQALFLEDIRQLVNSAKRPLAAIISSQHLHEVEAIADRIIFVREGRAVYNGRVDDFGADRDENAYELGCDTSRERLEDLLEQLPRSSVIGTGRTFWIRTARAVDKKSVLEVLLKGDVSIRYFRDISNSTRKLFEVDL
jgi:ABC-2 type transport system ATP-binding protein